uniref:Alpha-amylase C-terminal domain-containing protein n=1 Tax=Acrobeloides nanus TaxID=290746 RepID=A0A914D483_9BILA
TTSPKFDSSNQTCQQSSGWVCEHRWPEIRNLAKFHQTTTGAAATAITSGNNALAFARSGKGYFALNNNNNVNFNLNTQTTLPVGTYCDVYSGELVNNQCTGTQIIVGSDGKASISVLPNSIVAIHIGARIGGPPPDPTPPPSSWQTTVILLHRDTEPGQDIFIRGGNDKNGACKAGPYMQSTDPCAIQIAHTTNVSFIFVEYLSWSQSDNYLDFEGAEQYQGTHDGQAPLGTPTVYSTNDPQAPEYQPYNTFGPGYWLVQFKMDCSKTYNGWFELKGYEDQNVGWEPDVSQGSCSGTAGGTAPFKTNNHVAKCGYVNVFDWGTNSCTINNL